MKKLTRNQALYQKEIKRIRTNLSKLRRQGYDVSELASRYTSKLPNRVTSKMLSELHNITPKKLKLELQDKYVAYTPKPRTPLTTKPEEYKSVYAPSSFPQLPIKSDYQYIPPLPTGFMDLPTVLPDEETFEETPDSIETEPEEPEEERLTQRVVDEEKGKVYTIGIETGEIIDEADLYIEEDEEGTLHYIDGDTGDEVGRKEYAQYDIPTMDREAYENFEMIINSFPMHYAKPMMDALNKMINERGFQAVASALTTSMLGRPNVLEKLTTVGERYEEARSIIEEVADILDVPINLKEEIKDYVYREQMSDIEKYGT